MIFRNQNATIQNLERTVGQMATRYSERPLGTFPSTTQLNPNATTKVVTTRSGRGARVEEPVVDEEPVNEEIEMEAHLGKVQNRLSPASTAQPESPPKVKVVQREFDRLPYPARLKTQKMEKEYGHFLDLFKQLKVNLPFVEALQHMPKYAKFLKDLLYNKKKLEEISIVTLGEECSVVVQNKLPQKMIDPGSFTIPCLFGSSSVSHVLANLGASINLIPYLIYSKLDLGELVLTRMSIQLVNRSVKYPRGIVENILVKVKKACA
uniref:Aspartic peptidase domain-containing protein n=1 Tax=Helianthus annuus TaxID=4232 RepID=A0A251RZ31_HELAN